MVPSVNELAFTLTATDPPSPNTNGLGPLKFESNWIVAVVLDSHVTVTVPYGPVYGLMALFPPVRSKEITVLALAAPLPNDRATAASSVGSNFRIGAPFPGSEERRTG